MKNYSTQKGFVIPLIIAVVVVLAAGGVYWGVKGRQQMHVPPTPTAEQIEQMKKSPLSAGGEKFDVDPNSADEGNKNINPLVSAIIPNPAIVGTTLNLNGKDLAGFEGDIYLFLERADLKLIRLRGVATTTHNYGDVVGYQNAIFTLKEPCQEGQTVYGDYSGLPAKCDYVKLTPGIYKAYIKPWGKKSNVVELRITSAPTQVSTPTNDPTPVITSISLSSGPIGTTIDLTGSGLSGFEGDLNVTFERADGRKILLKDTFGDYAKTQGKLIKVIVKEPCQEGQTVYGDYSGAPTKCEYVKMTPGVYKVYTMPWGKKSNTVQFTITN